MPTLAERLQSLVGGGYRIERELPLGGMSRLYIAHDLAVEREVVVKVLPPDLACSASIVRFRREVELTAQLLHPNILPVLVAGGADDVLYYVTPFVAGESLRELLAREGALPLDAVTRVLDDVLDALAHAHSRGVVHRDVKPANILLAAGGRAMLADFGIARALSASALSAADTTRSDVVPGTPAYMAPEHPSDAHADLWATCVVAHEMLTGTRPAPGVTAAEIRRARRRALGAAEERRTARLAEVVARGLAADPARRFADVEALRSAVVASRQRRLVTRRGLAAAAGVAIVTLAGFAATRPSMEAARARERGREAAAHFALDSAIAAYREALGHDSSDAGLRLALARTLAWRGEDADLTEATRLLRVSRPAPAQAREHAALLALAERRYPEACRAFAEVTRRDSSDASAWMGLAECERRDGAIVTDAASPSGHAFRTSYDAAGVAYEHALDLVPNADAATYRRLARVRMSDPNAQRLGRTLLGDTVFVAYPALVADTVAYVPWKPPQLVVPPSRNDAIERNVARLRDRFRDWTRAAPRAAAAHEALAGALEKLGFIETSGPDDLSALGEIALARQHAETTAQLPLVHVEVRLRLKANDWRGAARLADSVLAHATPRTAAEAERLAGLAALTGRRARLDTLLRLASGTVHFQVRAHDGSPLDLPQPVMQERAAFLGTLLLGGCADVRDATDRMRRSLRASVPDDTLRQEGEHALLERPLLLVAQCGDVRLAPDGHPNGDPLVQLHAAWSSGGATGLRKAFRRLDERRRYDHPGNLAVDYAYGESLLLLAAGDTSAALQRLDVALDALPGQGPYVLSDPLQSAALVRAMELCTRLAAAHGDRPTVRRWSEAVATLWAHADPPLDGVVTEMQRLATGASERARAAR